MKTAFKVLIKDYNLFINLHIWIRKYFINLQKKIHIFQILNFLIIIFNYIIIIIFFLNNNSYWGKNLFDSKIIYQINIYLYY